jgi:DNA-binding MarR family transcriptional regulator
VSPQQSLEQSYLILFHFLLLSKRRIFSIGADYGLSGMQTILAVMLDRPRPMHHFKKLFNCDASNITGIVDGLEEKGLAERCSDPKDRRLKMVRLSPAGKALRTSIMEQFAAHDSPLLSRLDARELKMFIALLEKITAGEQNCPAQER